MITDSLASLNEHFSVLAEPHRCRLLILVEKQELTVSELCAVLQLPQSTVSRHLRTLLDRGWVESRPEGTRRLYRSTVDRLGPLVGQIWALTRDEFREGPAGRSDTKRLQSVLSRRRSRSQEFFETSSDRWDGLREELFGSRFSLQALVGLLPRHWRVADLGCGTGSVTEAIAPWVEGVFAVDTSTAMLEVAAQRLQHFDNVELRHGHLENLPLDDSSVDAVTMMLVLHHLEQPELAIAEASRCLRPDGRIVIVDIVPHERIEYQQEMGHVWMGFPPDVIEELLKQAGFDGARFSVLPPSPEAKGPNLFVVSAIKRR